MTVVGWTDNWNDSYPTVTFTAERHKALVERIRKRRYNFSYQMLQLNPYSTPVYNDKVKCLLSKDEWDHVLADAYGDERMPMRCTPMDILTLNKSGILWEKEKFYQETVGDNHG